MKRREAISAGLSTYTTGRYCRRGHMAERYTKSGVCVECARQNAKKFRSGNRDEYNDYMRRRSRMGNFMGYNVSQQRHDEVAFTNHYRRRRAILRATPVWADRNEIRRIYDECDRTSVRYSMEFIVDHIVPIRHRNVCGLNVPWNLKVVSKSLARKKGRKLSRSKVEREMMQNWG